MRKILCAIALILPTLCFAGFDENDPADILALNIEVYGDPTGMNYAPVIQSTASLLSLLNDSNENIGNETGEAPMTPGNLLNAIWGISISSQDQFKIELLFTSAASQSEDISDFKAEVSALAPSISLAIQTIIRPLSRAEVLFADVDENGVVESVTIPKSGWIKARDL